MAISPSYDRERAKRYKKWWARQKGQPAGELIEVSSDTWQKRNGRLQVDETRASDLLKAEAAGEAKG